MKSMIEEGVVGRDMPPLPEETWRGVRLLRLIESDFFTTSSDTSVTWSITENGSITTQGNTGRNGIIRWYEPITGRWLSNDPIGISGGLNQYQAFLSNPVNFTDPDGLNAYVINADGYLGHTSIAVDNPSGGVNVYHYYARGHHAGANSWNTLKAFVYDKVDMWSEYYGSIEEYLSMSKSGGSKVSVEAIALGTSQDDASFIDYMDDETCKDEGYYSGLSGRECHTTSWSAFWTYGMGPMKSFPTPKLDIMKSNPMFKDIPLPDRTYMTPNLMMPSIR